MNNQESTPAPLTKPAWATECDEVAHAGGAVRWIRPVHEVADGIDLRVEVSQFADDEGADAPVVRVWIEGNTLDLIGVDEAKLTPEWLERLGLELLVGAFRAQAILNPSPLSWEPDEGAVVPSTVAMLPSTVVARYDHWITRTVGAVEVHLANDDLDFSTADARRYIVEAARVIAIAESL